MEVILTAVLGSFCNRIRGGLIEWIPGKKIINALIFGWVFGIFTLSNGLWLAVIVGLLSTVAMYFGSQPGWGTYIGSLGGWQTTNLGEFDLTNTKWTRFFNASFYIDNSISWLKPWPVLWGFAGLTLRGAFWGGLIGLAQLNYWPLLAGSLMAVIYLIAIKLCKVLKTKNWQGDGWETGEWWFGALLWSMCLIGV